MAEAFDEKLYRSVTMDAAKRSADAQEVIARELNGIHRMLQQIAGALNRPAGR